MEWEWDDSWLEMAYEDRFIADVDIDDFDPFDVPTKYTAESEEEFEKLQDVATDLAPEIYSDPDLDY